MRLGTYMKLELIIELLYCLLHGTDEQELDDALGEAGVLIEGKLGLAGNRLSFLCIPLLLDVL